MMKTLIELDQGWQFKDANDTTAQFLPVAQFPTNIHLDLQHHGLIPDPFFAKNELDVQWVGERAWIYRTTFPTPQTSEADAEMDLVFDGLDTFASVFLNGEEILKTENMFIPERVTLTNLLRAHHENELSIRFESAWLRGQRIVKDHPEHRWGCWNGDPSRLAVRKAQYHYGWDWGPRLITCGPWRPIRLEIYTARIDDLYFTTDVHPMLVSAQVVAKVHVVGRASQVVFALSLADEMVGAEVVGIENGVASATFRTGRPRLWYPTGYGGQPLYTLTAKLLLGGSAKDSATKRFGLRRAEVFQCKLMNAPGTAFMFQINNVPIFCGGSNWIPADSFIPRVTPEKYRQWVKMIVEGNQVMLRIWGGGIYEEQALYDACDELGVLVWQDFPFACGNYPAYPAFLEQVEREARANVKRLRHHPSIVIWAGNNEDYQYVESEGLDYNPQDKDPQSWLKSSFPARYIYEKLLVDVTRELIPQTYYHFGSPFGGKNTRDSTSGMGTQEPYQKYDQLGGRFVSEFGMAALPDARTIDSYLPSHTDERYPQSSTMEFHHKAAGGQRRLAM
ncbi:MAG: hypothetical protein M1823_003905 [Watsoniomyces obsoletus]|nr:MAG: hypothetical protein M1823_003905 [Watsoniomyces obsoletus]